MECTYFDVAFYDVAGVVEGAIEDVVDSCLHGSHNLVCSCAHHCIHLSVHALCAARNPPHVDKKIESGVMPPTESLMRQ